MTGTEHAVYLSNASQDADVAAQPSALRAGAEPRERAHISYVSWVQNWDRFRAALESPGPSYKQLNVWGRQRELPQVPPRTFRQWYLANRLKKRTGKRK